MASVTLLLRLLLPSLNSLVAVLRVDNLNLSSMAHSHHNLSMRVSQSLSTRLRNIRNLRLLQCQRRNLQLLP
jgi:hypothetical protein